jgi:hypothetical protein
MNKSFFERINFFKGFFTTADDWQKAQKYHLEKGKLHNRYLHTPGVVSEGDNESHSLEVTAASQGTAINVAPGYAIDGEGRDLYLPKPEQVQFVPNKYHLPTTVYVSIKYDEEEFSKRTNPANPEYAGYAFIREVPLVEITTVEPDNHHAVELARIELSSDATRLKDARDANNPVENEIDLRYVKKAGSKAEHKMVRLADLVEETKSGTSSLAGMRSSTMSIETLPKTDSHHRFYLASVFPDKETKTRLRWYIESSRDEKGKRQYKLIIENLTEKSMKVHYKVYRYKLQ